MHKIDCRCGATNKTFRYDIGPFFVSECCAEAGFDDLGRNKAEIAAKEKAEVDAALNTKPSQVTTKLQAFFGKAGGRGKLMDMNVPELRAMAQAKGVQGIEGMNKKKLVAAILGS